MQPGVRDQVSRRFSEAWSSSVHGILPARAAALGYEIDYSHFDATIAIAPRLADVLAFRRGQLPEILVIMAHYDTAGRTFRRDGRRLGIGVLVELGGFFDRSLRHSLLLVASDGEEWGMLGRRTGSELPIAGGSRRLSRWTTGAAELPICSSPRWGSSAATRRLGSATWRGKPRHRRCCRSWSRRISEHIERLS